MTFPYLSKVVARSCLVFASARSWGQMLCPRSDFLADGSLLLMCLSQECCLICQTESACCVKNSMNFVGKTLRFEEACWTETRGHTNTIGVWYLLCVFVPDRRGDRPTGMQTERKTWGNLDPITVIRHLALTFRVFILIAPNKNSALWVFVFQIFCAIEHTAEKHSACFHFYQLSVTAHWQSVKDALLSAFKLWRQTWQYNRFFYHSVCLSGNPLHLSAILLTVCFHLYVIIWQKKNHVTHTSSLADKPLHLMPVRAIQAPEK